jgi:hypothetical protein
MTFDQAIHTANENVWLILGLAALISFTGFVISESEPCTLFYSICSGLKSI